MTSPTSTGATATRTALTAARRIVIKLGTRVLTDESGALAASRISAVVTGIARLRKQDREVVIVSSGAVGLGRSTLGVDRTCPHRGTLQVCAAVGQAELMATYQQALGRHELPCAQLLLGHDDFESRKRTLHLRHVAEQLLERGVVPIINENDALGTSPNADATPTFTDNDRLAAMVANEINADALILATDVDGVYDADPRRHEAATVLPMVESAAALPELSSRGSSAGRGGMASKAAAALCAARGGTHAVIVNGRTPGVIDAALDGEPVGTWFVARPGLSSRERWIALTGPSRGAIEVDDGAAAALRDQSASLLPTGVRTVSGSFAAGDIVDLIDTSGVLLGRGLVRAASDDARRACQSVRERRPLIRRNNIVLTSEPRACH